ncbi:MAG TPA: class I SAM-dependent methyltransferase [Myxococcaceae bacterium]|nr:class I SAM-dependent methyltransferase [Myxococcaceae bacterium]
MPEGVLADALDDHSPRVVSRYTEGAYRRGVGDSFHSLEKAGWSDEGVVETYGQLLASLTTQAIPALLQAVAAGGNVRLLDVASGLGEAAAAAAARGAKVSAVDFSAAMVERARHAHVGIDFRQGDAEALPFPDQSFDAVVCNFGMLHFPNPERVLGEMWRVLIRGGRLAFTVWAAPERTVVFRVAQSAALAHGDPAAVASLPQGPAFFRFSDYDECVRTLSNAGYAECRAFEVPQVWRLASVDELLRALAQGTVRNRALLRAQSDAARARIERAVREGVAAWLGADGTLEIPMPAVLACGTASPRQR